jgi:exopolyphosphatase/guanosine-5'-triphosphate,3'-diphosphate pyrophosphatase
MRFAIIDCGTNTFHLLIAERINGSVKTIYKTKQAVKLGEGGILNKIILPEPYQRGLAALASFRKKIDGYNIKEVIAYGTAALRTAKNGKAFVADAWNTCRIKPELISGSREAALIYKGVSMAVPPKDGVSLIMDIGGGSTEFILCNEKKILWKKSFPAGAALLLEKFNPSNPLTATEHKAILKWHDELLQPLFQSAKKWKPERLIGSSGSFDTFAEMILLHASDGLNALKGKTSYQFRMDEYCAVHNVLLHSTTEERMNMKGLVKMRVDMIVMGTIQLSFVLKKLNIKSMYLSRYALKEGMLKEIAEGNTNQINSKK